ncbi:hypothetical protein GALMADRAFT_226716 [Galerina marginata CBS 339.88]|uniref:F-box domain-containing protein n=1 Tax=Galerina marginata (strain CBS 339.88) TaxID=685588 RepID=A0A067SVX0_GALM3|nr:hypothetical protein GALMADRAFT_226716 [Galerina marginata CBS 339.88]
MSLKGVSGMLSLKVRGHAKFLKSPTPLLLRSNDPPSEQELALIHDTIATTEARLQEIRTTGSPPSQTLDSYSNFLQAHEALLSASRRLPPELLVEIFLHFHEFDSPNAPPWTLTHVCRRWRQVAVGITALWRDIPPLFLGSLGEAQVRQRIDCLSMLLQRSSHDKITFFLSKQLTNCLDDNILALLFKHSERWERISLVISEDVCAHFSRVKGRVSSLRSLKLVISRTGRLHVGAFETAPKLQEVNLASSPWSGLVQVPWSQLTGFTEESMECNHLPLVLKSATNLKTMSFTFSKEWLSVSGLSLLSPTTLTHLTTLVIQSFNGEPGVIILLSKLTLPSLEDAQFRCFIPLSVASDVSAMINRSSCRLQKLVLHMPRLAEAQIDQVLLSTPSLVFLDLNDPDYGLVDLLSQLEPGRECEWKLVPHLKSLTIHIGRGFYNLDVLRDLARMRCDLIFPDSIVLDGKPSRLDLFKIVPTTTHDPLDYVKHFGLGTNQSRFGVGNNLTDTNNTLDKNIREIKLSTNQKVRMSRKSRNEQISSKMEITVSLLERLETTTDMIIYLYFKKIERILLQVLLEVQIPMNLKISISKRLDALRPRWSSALNRISSELKWGWDKYGNLLYIPENNAGCRGLVSFDFYVADPEPMRRVSDGNL